jgi:GAF domain-containing protein
MSKKTMIVGDRSHDKHFHSANLTIGSDQIRYYAGAPIRVLGQYIGTVCAIDVKPHEVTTPAMKSSSKYCV